MGRSDQSLMRDRSTRADCKDSARRQLRVKKSGALMVVELGKFCMTGDLDPALQVDVLAAALHLDHQEAKDLLEFLAQKLEQSLPQATTVTRSGGLFTKNHPVKEILVRFDDYHYQLTREKHGALTARVLKLVRGVVLKTTEISVDQWTAELAQQLAQLAERSAQTRQALNKFVLGD